MEFWERTGTRRNQFPLLGLNNEDDDLDFGDSDLPVHDNTSGTIAPALQYHWDEDIDSPHNSRLIQHVAKLVYTDEMVRTRRTVAMLMRS